MARLLFPLCRLCVGGSPKEPAGRVFSLLCRRFSKKARGGTEIMPRLPCSKPMKDKTSRPDAAMRLPKRRPSGSKDAQMRGVATMKEFEDA